MKRTIAAAAAAALAVIGLASPATAAETKFDLIANGGTTATSQDIGDVFVTDDGATLAVRVVLNGELDASNNVPTLVYGISAEANCTIAEFPLSKGNPVPGQFDYQQAYPDGAAGPFEFTLTRPACDDPLVAVHADVKELGNIAGFNSVFPASVSFRLVQDTGADPDASYFDTTFTATSGLLAGETFNGWCVDVGHSVSMNTTYPATAYSILELPTGPIGNIDKPQNLPGVMWLLNNYRPGDVVTADITPNDGIANPVTRTLTSGDIQRAIWYIVDNTQSTSGLGAYSDPWAKYLADLGLANVAYAPASLCGLVVPIILVTNNNGVQTTIAQTTLVELGVPCADITATAMAMNTAVTVTEKGSVRYGEQFPGSNWFSYVIAL
jgi:hypothetical protein